MLYAKALLFTILVPGTALVVIPWLLEPWETARFEAGSWKWGGLLPVLIGVAALLTCILDFARVGRGTPAPIDPPRIFVRRGPYRWVRNPMYVAVLLTLAGLGLVLETWAIWAWAAFLAAGFHLFVVLHEEPNLRRRFGNEYVEYCRRVPRWIPRLF
ncbi:MAG: isoprenylcysteine carboxylmethyltransferase family protein [Planctomycetes bacterium]|nr:isoprenylcysteine carboxylmethyltransferase family protein [Planctomycetota bacterium]